MHVSDYLLTFKYIDLNRGLRYEFRVYKEKIESEKENKIKIRDENPKKLIVGKRAIKLRGVAPGL